MDKAETMFVSVERALMCQISGHNTQFLPGNELLACSGKPLNQTKSWYHYLNKKWVALGKLNYPPVLKLWHALESPRNGYIYMDYRALPQSF